MATIIVTSTNPVKVNSTLKGFREMFGNESFTHEMVSSPSGVSDQPMGDDETFRGAMNRVMHARTTHPNGDYWVGIEGGLETRENEMYCFAWVVVQDKHGKIGQGKTGSFMIPPKMSELVRQGVELGKAHDIVMNSENTKQKNGTVGALTNDKIDRTGFYVPAVIFALIPFTNKELF